MKTGTFDDRTSPRTYSIPPYGRTSLGGGIGSITLVSCDAAALQLVCDGAPTRLNEGATMPMNGQQRFLRNPYSRTVHCMTLEDLPVNVAQRRNEDEIGFQQFHQNTFIYRPNNGVEEADRRIGMALIAGRGGMHVNARGWSDLNVSLLRRAKAEYADDLPVGVLDERLYATDSAGESNENYLVQCGSFTDLEIGTWITSTGWDQTPVTIAEHNSTVDFVVAEGMAVFLANRVDRGFEMNMVITDLGDWDAMRTE